LLRGGGPQIHPCGHAAFEPPVGIIDFEDNPEEAAGGIGSDPDFGDRALKRLSFEGGDEDVASLADLERGQGRVWDSHFQ